MSNSSIETHTYHGIGSTNFQVEHTTRKIKSVAVLDQSRRTINSAGTRESSDQRLVSVLDDKMRGGTFEDGSHIRFSPPLVVAASKRRRRHFIATGRWEGAVTERLGTFFEAEVVDLDTDEMASAEFNLDELASADLALCEPGALFYWTIGYETKDNGQKSRVSTIRFRRTGRDTLA